MNSNPQDGTSVKKYGLALHTASRELGLAISNFAGDSRCQTWNLDRDLATHLHQYLVEFIQPQTWADLAFIAVAKGPGGFTGTRMGMVTARTLAQQLDIPVFAISTLAAVAWAAPPQPALAKGGLLSAEPPVAKGGLLNTEPPLAKGGLLREDMALQMPAQRGQLFGAVYSVNKDSGLTELFPDTVMTAESWQEKLESWENSYQLIEVGSELGSSVSSVLELAYLEWKQGSRPDWSDALPYYGQHPVKGH
ncbi:tRNA (adenosine(37)-N6)-threonylcarbamoyltransferase complex dimerization subunit type 1 TsaB [Microcoleus vaginatus GB1-A2]|uniref:tRNA (adenosine(37)-N6)-threonylcarbamoyltransferase complex dimerization subunit type 1 TsaB n=1 Tax=Microcoleus vaginatus TaxID=119532 RepID=UPI001689CE23|nr:tRNA (adenosine(37)-N6)-threonylcarbamoyltransferase complex dimerization subunit type 1 TsaB [Microcoleus sp. FACHB-61]